MDYGRISKTAMRARHLFVCESADMRIEMFHIS